jgi:hypothetical protein
MDRLPLELVREIVVYLENVVDCVHLGRTCKKLYHFAISDACAKDILEVC